MRGQHGSWIPVMLSSILCVACAGGVPRANSPLTEDELAIPLGPYQMGGDMYNRRQVRMPSPEEKPVLDWRRGSVALQLVFLSTVLVDGEGGIWYESSESSLLTFQGLRELDYEELSDTYAEELPYSNTSVVRLNPDGTKDWEHRFGEAPGEEPVSFSLDSAMNGVVVCGLGYFEGGELGFRNHRRFLECIDLMGTTKWRTDPVPGDFTNRTVWRVTDDRVLMACTDETWNVYSLSDGSHLGSIRTPGHALFGFPGPFPTHDGNLIMFGTRADTGRDYVSKMDFNGNTRWYEDFPDEISIYPPTLSNEEAVIIGSHGGLLCLNSGTGEYEWTRFEGEIIEPMGVSTDGNILCFSIEKYVGPRELRMLDPSGNILWTCPMPELAQGLQDIHLYEDGSILVGYAAGVSLIDPEGSMLWTVDESDLGLSTDSGFSKMELYPAPDGRIVVHYVTTGDDGDEGILSLKPPI